MKSPYTDMFSTHNMGMQIPYSVCTKIQKKKIYGTLKRKIGMILRELCRRKEAEVISAEACPDHIHMYVSIPSNTNLHFFLLLYYFYIFC